MVGTSITGLEFSRIDNSLIVLIIFMIIADLVLALNYDFLKSAFSSFMLEALNLKTMKK